MKLRASLYLRGSIPSDSVHIPVISVGNISLGGSGKTPVVIFLAEKFIKKGFRVAVVSRGYGGRATGHVNLVSDGEQIFLDAADAGDEPRLIAESVKNAMVLTGKKRIAPCRFAQDNLGANLIILDDGFQHMAMERDVDLVLFNGSTLFQNYHVIPGGVLREPISSLVRADCACITGNTSQNNHQVERFTSYLKDAHPDLPVFILRTKATHFIDQSNSLFPLEQINGRAIAFSGIASPKRFHHTLESSCLDVISYISYKDHCVYNQKKIDDLCFLCRENDADYLITTKKDMVKLKGFSFPVPLLAIETHIEECTELIQFIENMISSSTLVKKSLNHNFN